MHRNNFVYRWCKLMPPNLRMLQQTASRHKYFLCFSYRKSTSIKHSGCKKLVLLIGHADLMPEMRSDHLTGRKTSMAVFLSCFINGRRRDGQTEWNMNKV